MAVPAAAAAGAGILSRVAAINSVVQIGGGILKGMKDSLPRNIEQVTVTVWGGPTATRMGLYRLAMGVVWGQLQRRDFLRIMPPGGKLVLSYNLEEKSVTVECVIQTTYLSALLGLARNRRRYEVFQGPKESVVGGEWAFTSILPGLPGSNPGIDLRNGFEGRTLITSEAVYKDPTGNLQVSRSPTPPGDRLSRGLATIARSPAALLGDPANWNNRPDHLLFAALSEPCGANNLFPPVYSKTPLGNFPVPSPNRPPDAQVSSLYSSGLPSDSPYVKPSEVIDAPDSPVPTTPPTTTSKQPYPPTTLNTGDPIPPGNPAGIPIFDGGDGNINYDPGTDGTGP